MQTVIIVTYGGLIFFIVQVCDAQFTEIIPCLDISMNKKLKLKLNHSVMEHYERHCPPADHRLNCVIPPPPNYKVPDIFDFHDVVHFVWLRFYSSCSGSIKLIFNATELGGSEHL